MSALPPQLESTQPGTPPTEWARSTTTAAFDRTLPLHPPPDPFHPISDALSPPTPGAQFPGAYPQTPGEQPLVSADTLMQTAHSAATSASNFVQSAAGAAAQYLPQGVVDTVSSYIPTSSATATMTTARASEHDTEHTTSFPTREFSGAASGERTAGVGSLPGPLNEASVTKLPDERVDDERYLTTAAAAASLASGAYALKDRMAAALPSAQDAQAAKDTLHAKAQDTAQTIKQAAPPIPGVTSIHSTAVTASTVPSREHFGAQPGDHSSGAGALPGLQEEPHVARLPEESAHPQYDSGPTIDTSAQVALKPTEEAFGNEAAVGDARRVGGVGALVGARDESSVALVPDERAAQTTTGVQRGTMPSQEPFGNEAAGASKHVGGVGALVGNFNEPGAAVLPDERTQQQGTGSSTITQPKTPFVPPQDTAKPNAGGDKVLNVKSADHAAPNKVRFICLRCSREGMDGTRDAHSGDPGTGCFLASERDEHGRPREAQGDPLHATLRPRAHALGAEHAVWGGIPLSGASARAELGGDYDEPRADPSSEGPEGSGYDTEYHPADLHPASAETRADPASEGEESSGAVQTDAQRPSHQASNASEGAKSQGSGDSSVKAKKAGFMDKMRGEAKVLLGKIEHKPEKVEQGQRMKAGEATPVPAATSA
ncbi:hypothetical protein BC628DRAFT_1330201 [Trametes gibbosa]|nr:hypothetical protein BC628DRAFT_1330201 [Trametes gibbosa]